MQVDLCPIFSLFLLEIMFDLPKIWSFTSRGYLLNTEKRKKTCTTHPTNIFSSTLVSSQSTKKAGFSFQVDSVWQKPHQLHAKTGEKLIDTVEKGPSFDL